MRVSLTQSDLDLVQTMPTDAQALFRLMIDQPAFLQVVQNILKNATEIIMANDDSVNFRAELPPFFLASGDLFSPLSFLCECYFNIKVYGYASGTDQQIQGHESQNSFGFHGTGSHCLFTFNSRNAHYQNLIALKQAVEQNNGDEAAGSTDQKQASTKLQA